MKPVVVLPISPCVPCALLCAWALASCTGPVPVEPSPDERFGHRFNEEEPGGRQTVEVSPASADRQYFYYLASIDTVYVRSASFESGQAVEQRIPVEILVKGFMSDGCMELHRVEQERAGHIVTVYLETRKPRGDLCMAVVRPFRFYLNLDGLYEPGAYTLKLNDRVFPFTLRRTEGRGRSLEG